MDYLISFMFLFIMLNIFNFFDKKLNVLLTLEVLMLFLILFYCIFFSFSFFSFMVVLILSLFMVMDSVFAISTLIYSSSSSSISNFNLMSF